MIIHRLVRNLSNIPGWRTNRKIIVFESDDWGSIRMPTRKVFNMLVNKGLDLAGGDSLRYNKYDTLAKADDLAALFAVLRQFKDRNVRHPAFTAIALVANPDFARIAAADYQAYYYEPFTTTLSRYYGNQSAYKLWLTGIKEKLFVPQFHGREHLNVAVWIDALQKKDKMTREAFEYDFWGFNNQHKYNISYQAAFDLADPSELADQAEIIKSGLRLFTELFGYNATYFVPPNGPFNNSLEKTAAENGIEYMSAAKIQQEALGQGKTKKVFHYLGQQNNHGQVYITRNAFFEPSQEGKDWVDSCLADIANAFRWHKPAVISTHRVNYIGALDEGNRTRGLQQLKQLLAGIIKKWPQVEFLTSSELGNLISIGE